MTKVILSISFSSLIALFFDGISDNSAAILATFFSIGAGITISALALFSTTSHLKNKGWRYLHFYEQYIKAKSYPLSVLLYLYILSTALIVTLGLESTNNTFLAIKPYIVKFALFLSALSFLNTLQLPNSLITYQAEHFKDLKEASKKSNEDK